jgi:hypothetical protein
MEDMIKRSHAILYIDVTCYGCKKSWARSYCTEGADGRYYCQHCTPSLDETIKALKQYKIEEIIK